LIVIRFYYRILPMRDVDCVYIVLYVHYTCMRAMQGEEFFVIYHRGTYNIVYSQCNYIYVICTSVSRECVCIVCACYAAYLYMHAMYVTDVYVRVSIFFLDIYLVLSPSM